MPESQTRQKRKMISYRPPQVVLERYADVLVNFALNSGKGIKKGETIVVHASEYAKPLYVEILKAIWKAGGHAISRFSPDNDPEYNLERAFFEHAGDHQLDFFPASFMKGLVDEADHFIFILSEMNPHSLHGIDPQKIMKRGIAYKPYMEWRNEKENKGKFTWTVALYGTPAMATEARLSLQEYWNQIIKACFLDSEDPIQEWKDVYAQIEKTKKKLNILPIDKLHIEGPDADLWITIGKDRAWMGGSGRNVPSFELFTSPDWRGTEGWIRFNQPLYRYGNLIEGIKLEFKGGKVVKSSATKNHAVLDHMIKSPNADKIGEYSLTDKRFSRITKFMAETLFDENMGGPHGNTHLALGSSYHDCYKKNPAKVTKKQWEKLGYNDSPVHTDIISTAPRIVTAHMTDGSSRIIYKDGMFTL